MVVIALFLTLFAFPALAQDAAAGASSPFAGILPIVAIIGIFYFLIIRPQNKKMKEHQAMLEAIQRGDNIITGGGIHGKVSKVEEGGIITVKIADDVEVRLERSTISKVIEKPGSVEKLDASNKKEKQSSSSKKQKAANDNG